jgi:hypothetical protein
MIFSTFFYFLRPFASFCVLWVSFSTFLTFLPNTSSSPSSLFCFPFNMLSSQQQKVQAGSGGVSECVVYDKETLVVGYGVRHRDLVQDLLGLKVSRSVLITDETVLMLYGEKLLQTLKEAGLDVYLKTIPPGESSKSRKMKEEIEDWMLSLGCNRDTCVIGTFRISCSLLLLLIPLSHIFFFQRLGVELSEISQASLLLLFFVEFLSSNFQQLY